MPPGGAATSPRPTASATIWRRAACCSRTAAGGTRWKRKMTRDARRTRHQNAAAGPEGQGDHRARRAPWCRRPTRAAIRSSWRAATARSSRTWTATCSSTARPASPSTPPATRIPTSSTRSSIRRSVPAHVGHRLLLRAAGAAGRGAGGDRADRRAACDRSSATPAPRRSRRHQAGALPHEAAEHHRVPRRRSTAARWARCR